MSEEREMVMAIALGCVACWGLGLMAGYALGRYFKIKK